MAKPSDSRWAELRLIVHRPIGGNAAYAVIERRAEGRGPRDHLVARGVFPCPPGSPESGEWLEALRTALTSAYGHLGRRPTGAPSGGIRGGVQDPIPGLDGPATLETPPPSVGRSGA